MEKNAPSIFKSGAILGSKKKNNRKRKKRKRKKRKRKKRKKKKKKKKKKKNRGNCCPNGQADDAHQGKQILLAMLNLVGNADRETW